MGQRGCFGLCCACWYVTVSVCDCERVTLTTAPRLCFLSDVFFFFFFGLLKMYKNRITASEAIHTPAQEISLNQKRGGGKRQFKSRFPRAGCCGCCLFPSLEPRFGGSEKEKKKKKPAHFMLGFTSLKCVSLESGL